MYAKPKRTVNDPANANNAAAQRKAESKPAVPVLQQVALQRNAVDKEPVQGKFSTRVVQLEGDQYVNKWQGGFFGTGITNFVAWLGRQA
jgi:hypothetical protein